MLTDESNGMCDSEFGLTSEEVLCSIKVNIALIDTILKRNRM